MDAHRNQEPRIEHTGTIIHGTHLVEDLWPAWLKLLPDAAERDRYQAEYDTASREIRWELLFETLWDRLDQLAPEGYYFGTCPGDSSDYGFWEMEEDGDLVPPPTDSFPSEAEITEMEREYGQPEQHDDQR